MPVRYSIFPEILRLPVAGSGRVYSDSGLGYAAATDHSLAQCHALHTYNYPLGKWIDRDIN